MLKRLDWDSDFFGYNVGRIELSAADGNVLAEILKDAVKQKFNLLYWSIPVTDVDSDSAAVANKGFHASRMITYHQLLNIKSIPETPFQTESYLYDEVTSGLLSLALQSGHMSRFRKDPNFAPGKFGEMYRLWIERSVSGEIADLVVVSKDNETIRGFATVKCNNNTGRIGLVSVDAASRGMNIGTRLIDYIKIYCISKGCYDLYVDTQHDNEAANRFYRKCGFKVFADKNIYHFWL